MATPLEDQAVLERLDFVRSHTAECQRQNGIKRYYVLKRKTCTCPYYAYGVLDMSGLDGASAIDPVASEG